MTDVINVAFDSTQRISIDFLSQQLIAVNFLNYNPTVSALTNPMTSIGDLIVGGVAGVPTRLAQGGNGTFLGVSGGTLGYYTPAGSGTVTASAGALTLNSIVLGAGSTDTKVVAGIITDGVSQITLGVNVTTLGKLKMFGSTSGDATIQPSAVAGTATVITLIATSDTIVGVAATQTLASKTLTTPVIATGLTATGAGSINFSGSSATFITSTGANTLSGITTATNTTDSTSITTGSLITSGGLGVAKATFMGGKLKVKSNGSDPMIEAVADDGSTQANITATTYNVTGGGIFHGRLANGTEGSPTGVTDGQIVAGYGARAYTSAAAFQTSSPAAIHMVADGAQTSGNFGMFIRLFTTPNGSTTRTARLRIAGNGYHRFGTDAVPNYPFEFDATINALGAGIPSMVLFANSDNARMEVQAYGGTPVFSGVAAGGVYGTATRTLDGTTLWAGAGGGYDNAGTPVIARSKATINLFSNEDWTTAAQGTYFLLRLTPKGSTTRSDVLAIGALTTNYVNYTPPVRTGAAGVFSYMAFNTPADTGLTAATESIGEKWVTATRTWADGTVALQREHYKAGLTYNKTTTSATFTDIFNEYLDAPIAGAGVTFTRGHTLGVIGSNSATSSITGDLLIATAVNTAATSVGIGSGNINAGGSIISVQLGVNTAPTARIPVALSPAATASTGSGIGIFANPTITAAANSDQLSGMQNTSVFATTNGALTNLVAFSYVINTPTVTGSSGLLTSYQLYIAGGATATTMYGIYQVGTDQNVLGGTLTVEGFKVSNHIVTNSKSANYTYVLADAGSDIYHPASDNNARTFTIPANGSVAYPVGTCLGGSNHAATACTLAITTDTLVFLPTLGTGSRTIGAGGKWMAKKVASTTWEVTGNSLVT